MQQNSTKPQLIKSQFSTPLYSPRSTFSNHLKQLQSLKTSMIINIDKYILGNLKTQFQKRGKELSMLQFIHFAKKFLKDWNSDLSGREVKMEECLVDLWREIDLQSRGKITWQEFNSKIIQTSLNLKTLTTNAGLNAPNFRQFSVHLSSGKCQSPIQKIIYLGKKNKMAFFREESTHIQFFPTQPQTNKQQPSPQAKPIIIPQQQLKVETMIKVKEKNQPQSGTVQKPTRLSKMIKKDIKVSTYKNTVLDSIYLQDQKYDMLMVSCSDKYVRGYNVSNVVPVIAYQPQNQDQLMVHQFPFQIYNMAWDPVHEVLYGTGKYATIYQWLAKTDSEREMFDIRGHDGMISTMLMMPKLQLLATGGYDGKLLLWDTVGQGVKCRYQQHSRAICSITFQQQLVLLFTSGLDHKICVWNPYISSLIHKIDNTLNIIHLQIIPKTSYLLSLDQGGTVKLREVNRFSQISAFSIFRSQQQSEQHNTGSKLSSGDKEKQFIISMCSKKNGNIHYYFGTDKIVGYQFTQIEKDTINNQAGTFSTIKYSTKNLKLYTPLRNHILLWNLLTGKNQNTFYDLTEYDITKIEILQDANFIIVADTHGNLTQRKINNGHLIKNIIKMKTSINNLKLYELERNEKEKNTRKTYYLFSTTEQGEIALMKCHPKGDFQIHRHFSLKQDFAIINPNILEIDFFVQKHILIIWMASNDIVTIDVEKKTLLTKIQFGDQLIAGINVITGKENDHFLSIITKSSQLSGFYLPPHNKKFKTSCNLNLQDITHLQCSAYGPKSHMYFISTQLNELYSFKLDKRLLDVENETTEINKIWKTKLENRVSEMLLIQNQEILVLLNQSDDFTFISTSNGKIICHLRNQTTKLTAKQVIQPILYMNERTSQILIPNDQKIIKLFEDQPQPQAKTVQKVIDPNFFINYLNNKNIIDFNKVSNPSWDLNLNLLPIVDKRTQEIQLIQDKLKQYEKVFDKPGLIQIQKRIQIAIQLQNKWEKQKEKQKQKEQQTTQNIYTTNKFNSLQRKSTPKFDPKAFDNAMKKNTRGSSLSSLHRHQQSKNKLSEFSDHTDKKLNLQQNNDQIINSKFKNINLIEQVDLSRLQKDPLFRLGLALKSVNNKDQKAENFMQLAKKKDEIKLPKISSQKMKL